MNPLRGSWLAAIVLAALAAGCPQFEQDFTIANDGGDDSAGDSNLGPDAAGVPPGDASISGDNGAGPDAWSDGPALDVLPDSRSESSDAVGEGGADVVGDGTVDASDAAPSPCCWVGSCCPYVGDPNCAYGCATVPGGPNPISAACMALPLCE